MMAPQETASGINLIAEILDEYRKADPETR